MSARREYYKNGEIIKIQDDREVEEYKKEVISKLKRNINRILKDSDWQIIRLAERGIEIDPKIKAYRKKLFDKLYEIECDFEGIETLEELDQNEKISEVYELLNKGKNLTES